MTAQDLKNSILQKAMQGKLVEQRADEGIAAELLVQIKEEKKKLVKEGKIKKEKPLPEISEDEIPFEIPESWEWVRFGSIVEYNMGKTPPRAEMEWWKKDVPWVSISDMPESGHISQTKEYVSSTAIEKKFNNHVSPAGTLLMSFKLTVGRVSILDIDAVHNEAIISIYPYSDNEKILQSYLFQILPFVTAFGDSKNAIKGKTLNNVSIQNLPVPLPPLAEQKRIVAKIEELIPLVEQYGKAYDKLEQFNKKFPEDMRKSILQYAMQGKLVKQRTEEGTAAELILRIKSEKDRLIKEGKIKKEKPLPEINDEEKPFDIPDSWEWVRLGDILSVQSSKRVFEKDYVSDGIPFFRSKEIGDLSRGEQIKTELFITKDHFEQLKTNYGVPEIGDILITSVGTIGNTWICDGREFYYKDGNITQIKSSQFISSDYIVNYINSPLFTNVALATVSGTAYSALTIIKLKNMILPLPPLAEQHRIVEAIEKLMPYCNSLSKQ